MLKAERPSREALEKLVSYLDGPVEDLVRKDSVFKKLGLNPQDYVDNPSAVVDVLEKHGQLLQRPVIIKDNRAVVGRPRDRVNSFLAK